MSTVTGREIKPISSVGAALAAKPKLELAVSLKPLHTTDPSDTTSQSSLPQGSEESGSPLIGAAPMHDTPGNRSAVREMTEGRGGSHGEKEKIASLPIFS